MTVDAAGRSPLDGRRAQAAAWTHSGPAQFPALDGHVTFSWRQLEWFEEDERALVHARDPYKRVDTLRSSRRVDIRLHGELLASTARPLLLFETSLPVRYYLPFEDVRTDLFGPSNLVTMCPYKGTARYWSVVIGDTVVPDLAWSYPAPSRRTPRSGTWSASSPSASTSLSTGRPGTAGHTVGPTAGTDH